MSQTENINKKIVRLVFHLLIVFLISIHSYGQDSVIIIRHGEKPANGDNLDCKGLNRALGLPEVLHSKIGVPYYTYIPAIETGKATKHARMFQTVSPFAIKYNLEINSKFDKTDSNGVVKEVTGKLDKKHKHGTILLVWEHHNIPPITRALGVPAGEVPEWDDNDFDSIWIITYAGTKNAVLTIAHEGLNDVSSNCP